MLRPMNPDTREIGLISILIPSEKTFAVEGSSPGRFAVIASWSLCVPVRSAVTDHVHVPVRFRHRPCVDSVAATMSNTSFGPVRAAVVLQVVEIFVSVCSPGAVIVGSGSARSQERPAEGR